MKPFIEHTGIVAPLMRININTDDIIPSREITTVHREGLKDGLFAEWRYISLKTREENPNFVLNQNPFKKASILLTGDNFGCGSSREHAVWAIEQWGIRVIIASSFGSIFRNNCIQNGILPISLKPNKIKSLQNFVEADPRKNQLTVNLEHSKMTTGDGTEYPFEIDPSDQQKLLRGIDAIELTLENINLIKEFEHKDKKLRPWVYF
ncbi:MAG TPA: 3-isopropylmalate dehydratase small subunit [Gammaproteobacteria bacterium]|jgi:3-isopropylmalate/(R)-2-methylmalate dehydratase small subunit|nr:3-isopropylmalate dehydratase small subunit [Gammaproteobacteria bacterium]HJP42475.1 3-isopropylmalate dehydratase small subunit [Gammaproteobacteria bacterium]|tara:strand:+ start:1020 stop:1640 length:621 start_codon:yes stop_codon:yes gene_type:complete